MEPSLQGRSRRETEDLFLHCLEELERRIALRKAADGKHHIMGMTVDLRRLLADESPLIHQVNREYRLPMRFVAVRQDPIKEGALLVTNVSIFPRENLGVAVSLTLDDFLAFPLVYFEGAWITVKQVIDFEGNVSGGIHPGQAALDQATLVRLKHYFGIGAMHGTAFELIGVARVVLAGLHPLREAVLKNRGQSGA